MALGFTGSGGANSYCLVAHNANLNMTTAITLMNWVYITDLTKSFECFFHKGPSGSVGNYDFYFHGGYLWFELNSGGYRVVNQIVSLSANTWYHLAVSFNKPNVKFYVDGVQVGAGGSLNYTSTTNTNGVYIGNGNSYTSPLYGRLFDSRIYQSELTANQILTIAKGKGNEKINVIPSLRLLMNEKPDGTNSDNSAGEIRDISGNSNHGTCYSTPKFYSAPLKLHKGA